MSNNIKVVVLGSSLLDPTKEAKFIAYAGEITVACSELAYNSIPVEMFGDMLSILFWADIPAGQAIHILNTAATNIRKEVEDHKRMQAAKEAMQAIDKAFKGPLH